MVRSASVKRGDAMACHSGSMLEATGKVLFRRSGRDCLCVGGASGHAARRLFRAWRRKIIVAGGISAFRTFRLCSGAPHAIFVRVGATRLGRIVCVGASGFCSSGFQVCAPLLERKRHRVQRSRILAARRNEKPSMGSRLCAYAHLRHAAGNSARVERPNGIETRGCGSGVGIVSSPRAGRSASRWMLSSRSLTRLIHRVSA